MLSSLPNDITVWGGNLQHPSLSGFKAMDLLASEDYLWKNAGITAQCAVNLADSIRKDNRSGSSVLIIGWGRIGKQLARILDRMNCTVTIASQKEEHLSQAEYAGYKTIYTDQLCHCDLTFSVIFNTAPSVVIPEACASSFQSSLKIDLASCRGIEGPDVVWARGLPGTMMPEKSGALIASTILHALKEETL